MMVVQTTGMAIIQQPTGEVIDAQVLACGWVSLVGFLGASIETPCFPHRILLVAHLSKLPLVLGHINHCFWMTASLHCEQEIIKYTKLNIIPVVNKLSNLEFVRIISTTIITIPFINLKLWW